MRYTRISCVLCLLITAAFSASCGNATESADVADAGAPDSNDQMDTGTVPDGSGFVDAATDSGETPDGGAQDVGAADAGGGGTKTFGQACTDNSECQSNLCFTFGTGEQLCTITCSAATDCPSGSQGQKCNKQNVCRP